MNRALKGARIGENKNVLYSSYSSTKKRKVEGRRVQTWIDGSPLITDWTNKRSPVLDPRTQGQVGGNLYTVLVGREEALYFQTNYLRDEILATDFGIFPDRPDIDCAPLIEAMYSYFLARLPQTFLFAAGNYYPSRGINLHDRGHHLRASSLKSRAIFNFPIMPDGICRGFFVDGQNGGLGLTVENFKIVGAGCGPADGPRDEQNRIDRGIDNPYAYKSMGFETRSVVKLYNTEISAFGIGLKIQGYITNGGENASLFFIQGLNVQSCESDGVLINGADASAGMIMDWDTRDSRGWGLRDSSLLGSYYFKTHSNNNLRGTILVDGPGNSSIFVGLYTEEQTTEHSIVSPNAPRGYGGYTYGYCRVEGGSFNIPGTSAPGSPVYCQGNSSAQAGIHSTGINLGGLSIAGNGLYFSSTNSQSSDGFTMFQSAGQAGYSVLLGTGYTASTAQYFDRKNAIAQTKRFARVTSSNHVNPFINGHYYRLGDRDLKLINDEEGNPFLFEAGDEVKTQAPARNTYVKLICRRPGRYLAKSTTDLLANFVSGRGNEEPFVFALTGNDALPAVNEYIELIEQVSGTHYGPFKVYGLDATQRQVSFYGAIDLSYVYNYTFKVSYVAPQFQPLGAGSGLAKERPDLSGTGLLGPWDYYATDTHVRSTWMDTGWTEGLVVAGDIELTDAAQGIIYVVNGKRVRVRPFLSAQNQYAFSFTEL